MRFSTGRDHQQQFSGGSREHVIPFTKKQALGIICIILLTVLLGLVGTRALAKWAYQKFGLGNGEVIQRIEAEDRNDIHGMIGSDSFTAHFVYGSDATRDRNDIPADSFKMPYMWVTFTYHVDDIAGLAALLQGLKGIEPAPNGVDVKTFSVAVRKADEMKWATVWEEVHGVLESYVLSHPNKN